MNMRVILATRRFRINSSATLSPRFEAREDFHGMQSAS